MNILEKIVGYKKEELEQYQREVPFQELKDRVRDRPETLNFIQALKSPRGPYGIIAELKKESPSKGLLRKDFDPEQIAKSYVAGGASALSVLTDERFFGGHLDYLRKIRSSVEIPLLRKDFIWDPYQVYAAREAGADVLLLIVAMLPSNQLEDLHGLAEELGLAVLVEVHDTAECETALKINPKVIGVNNRDLRSFRVDLKTSIDLFSKIPAETLKISESGIGSMEDLKHLKLNGADAFLVGESLLKQEDPGAALKKLLGN